MEQICQLEEKWKVNPSLTFEDLNQQMAKRRVQQVLLKYQDGKQYCDIYLPLLELEAEYDKKVKEGQVPAI